MPFETSNIFANIYDSIVVFPYAFNQSSNITIISLQYQN